MENITRKSPTLNSMDTSVLAIQTDKKPVPPVTILLTSLFCLTPLKGQAASIHLPEFGQVGESPFLQASGWPLGEFEVHHTRFQVDWGGTSNNLISGESNAGLLPFVTDHPKLEPQTFISNEFGYIGDLDDIRLNPSNEISNNTDFAPRDWVGLALILDEGTSGNLRVEEDASSNPFSTNQNIIISSATSIPEPSCIFLLVCGTGLITRRRRQDTNPH